ncbi:MAG: hypothetical protein LBK26_04575 [Rickettsiales bacterium]|jgi:hypothetical protein|nr:hypothetical protein [Rickettsiales bacterium]
MELAFMTLLMLLIILIAAIASILISARNMRRIKTLEQMLARLSGAMAKMQGALKSRATSDAIVQNAEIIYQDLLQHIMPVMRAAGVSSRDSNEHELWRALGGILDEYNGNPFVLEQLRRLIKLDSAVSRAVDAFLSRAEHLLRHLAAADPDGLLASTFADGLLGQSMTLLSQAKQLAQS